MGFGQYSGNTYGRDLAKGKPREKQRRFVFGSHANTAHVWAQQQEETRDGRSGDGRMKFAGPTIYSYGSHFAIAHFTGRTYDGRAVVLFNANGYSSSTGKHRSHVRGALRGLPHLVIDVPDLTRIIDPSAKWEKQKHKARLNAALAYALEQWASAKRAADASPQDDYHTNHLNEARDEVKALKQVLGLRGALPRDPVKWSNDRKAREAAEKLAREKKTARAFVLAPVSTARLIEELGKELPLYEARNTLAQIRGALSRLRSARQTLGKAKAPTWLIKRASASLALLTPYEAAFKARVDVLERNAAEETDLEELRNLSRFLKEKEAQKQNPDFRAYPPQWLYNVPLAAQRWSTAIRKDLPELAEWLRVHIHAARWQVEVPAPPRKSSFVELTAEEWRAGTGSAYARIKDVPSYGGCTLLRRKGDKLETSRGAEVPWDHALKAFDAVQRARAAGREWRRNGHSIRVGHFQIDRIEATGDMVAGCHVLTWEEMQALAIREAPHVLRPAFPLPVPVHANA